MSFVSDVSDGKVQGDRGSAELLGFGKSFRNAVDGKDLCSLGGKVGDGNDSAEADGTAAEDDDGGRPVSLDVLGGGEGVVKVFEGVFGGKVAGGEDVGHEDKLAFLFLEVFWGELAAKLFLDEVDGLLDQGSVGEGDSDVVGLAAIQGRCAKQERLFTAGGSATLAVEAVSAGDGEGNDDFVADLEVLDVGADLRDDTGELVAHDEAGGTLLVAAEDV